MVNHIGIMRMKRVIEYLFKPHIALEEAYWQYCCYNRIWFFMTFTFCNPLLLCILGLFFGFTKQYNLIGILGVIAIFGALFTMMQMAISELVYKEPCKKLMEDLNRSLQ